jgi:hypothetical protein
MNCIPTSRALQNLLVAVCIFMLGVLAAACAERVEESLPEPSWSYIQPNLFAGTGHCTNCHTGSASGGAGMSLDFNQYATIVTDGALATGSTVVGEKIVAPGSKATSFLYRKITGTLAATGEGSRMPADGPPYLATDDIQLVGEWIDGGAPMSYSP